MGYPIFGKVKNIVLPVPPSEITLDEYKKKYGIEIRDIFECRQNSDNEHLIMVKSGNYVLFLNTQDSPYFHQMGALIPIEPISTHNVTVNTWISGTNDGEIILSTTTGVGIFIKIPKNASFSLDNATIRGE